MISQIDVVTRQLPLLQFQAMGGGSAEKWQESVFIRVSTPEGHTGVGEASAWPLFGGHSAHGHHIALTELFAPVLLGFDEREWAGLEGRLNAVVRGNRLAKAAVETAVLDLLARQRNEPLHTVFGGRSDFELGLSYSVSLQDLGAEREVVRGLYEDGYRAFKLKAGVLTPEDDVRRLLALRETCPQARLRLDYNEGASDAHLRAILGPAREVAVEYCEQPYPVGQERRLERLREWFDVPISLDESVAATQDLLRVAESKLCEYVSVKFSKVGGLLAAVRIAGLATELGITPYVGSQSETRLGVSAALAAMSAVDGLAYGSDFYFPYLIVDDTEIVGGPRRTRGHLGLPAGPGHGCTVPDSWWDGPRSDRLTLR